MTQQGKSSPSAAVAGYEAFARAIYETGVLSDPWFDAVERLGMMGLALSPPCANDLAITAERVAHLDEELARILPDEPALLMAFYRLTPCHYAMWQAAGGLWHEMARADLFICQHDARGDAGETIKTHHGSTPMATDRFSHPCPSAVIFWRNRPCAAARHEP